MSTTARRCACVCTFRIFFYRPSLATAGQMPRFRDSRDRGRNSGIRAPRRTELPGAGAVEDCEYEDRLALPPRHRLQKRRHGRGAFRETGASLRDFRIKRRLAQPGPTAPSGRRKSQSRREAWRRSTRHIEARSSQSRHDLPPRCRTGCRQRWPGPVVSRTSTGGEDIWVRLGPLRIVRRRGIFSNALPAADPSSPFTSSC